MYAVNPKRIYVMDWALQDERCVRRMERMVRGMGQDPGEVVAVSAEQLPDLIRTNGWMGEVRQGAYRESRDPDIIFNAFRWVTPEDRAAIAKSELFQACVQAYTEYGDCHQGFTGGRTLAMLGAAPFYHYERRPEWQRSQVCWSLHDLHSAWGCFHRCAYCQRGSIYVINLNLESFVERVDGLIAQNPWQKTFRYDVEQDVLAIEPEYGACELLVEDFAKREGKYLILFSKSANVDHLLPLRHNGHTIMLWTLSPADVSRRYEQMTGTLEERLEAACKCREAGYTVRFKCKPIIPVAGWRDGITDMLTRLYDTVEPENLSMEMVFFGSLGEMDATLGLENLDPALVAVAEDAQQRAVEGWSRDRNGPPPFPFEAKEEVYRHFIAESRRLSPSTPVTLCAETQRMWQALDDLLDYKPWDYVCNCGPHCTPGLERIETVDGPDAGRIARARAAGAIPVE